MRLNLLPRALTAVTTGLFVIVTTFSQQTKLPRIAPPVLSGEPPATVNVEESYLNTTIIKDLSTAIADAKSDFSDDAKRGEPGPPDDTKKYTIKEWGAWNDEQMGDFENNVFSFADERMIVPDYPTLDIVISADKIVVQTDGRYWLKFGVRQDLGVPGLGRDHGVNVIGSCENRRFHATLTVEYSLKSDWSIGNTIHSEINLIDGCDASFFNNDAVRILFPLQAIPIGKAIEKIVNSVIVDKAKNRLNDLVGNHLGAFLGKLDTLEKINERWHYLTNPRPLEREELQDAWLLYHPETVYLSSISVAGSQVTLSFGITARPKVYYQKEPPAPLTTPLPRLEFHSGRNDFHVLIDSQLDFDSASQMLEADLVSTIPPTAGNFAIAGTTVSGAGNELTLKTRMKGSIDGYIRLLGNVCLKSSGSPACPPDNNSPPEPNS
jgi:Domain of unknown function (DUF4403)